jgi:formylglycine-generating enzyme required for sulfatase activity
VDAEWVLVDEKKRTAPFKEEVGKGATYRVEITKDGYKSFSQEVKVGEAGEYRISARLKKALLPASLVKHFEIPKGAKDSYGNPVRKDSDKKTGKPLEIRHKQTGMHLVFIPAGEFMMGSPDNEKDREKDGREGPVHKVRLTKPFYMGKYEVTQAEWKAVMGNNPSQFPGDRNPVEKVSWDDCQEFLKKLNEKVGSAGFSPSSASSEERANARATSPFQLPTEAQWEYACRAGTQTRFFFGDDLDSKELVQYGWFATNSGGKSHAVGEKKPNAWGLHDMHGNVWEWCSDRFGNYPSKLVTDPPGPDTGGSRVYRGGSWYYSARYCRSAIRFRGSPGGRDFNLGFRVVLQVQR